MNLFNTFSPQSKLWIYQSDKHFNTDQVKHFEDLSQNFLSQWDSHGNPVKGDMKLVHNLFVLICADDADDKICGRSIASSMDFIKNMELTFDVKLMDRFVLAYKKDNEVIPCTLDAFKQLYQKQEVNNNTLVFNNTIHQLSDLTHKW